MGKLLERSFPIPLQEPLKAMGEQNGSPNLAVEKRIANIF
jgi:hypothetical protein